MRKIKDAKTCLLCLGKGYLPTRKKVNGRWLNSNEPCPACR